MATQEYRHGFETGWIIRSDGTPFNWADQLYNNTDAFGRQVTKNYKNVADIASHYPHSPERHRLFINGSRVFLQYGTDSRFEDGADYYRLKPNGGDVMTYRTAERFRYVANYILEASSAFDINQQLQGDDKVVFGYGDPDLENDMASANGWFREFTSDLDVDQVRLTTYRDGELLNSKTVSSQDYRIWGRLEEEINWYNVGNRISRQTYTENGVQFNDIIGQTSVDNQRGPSRANFPFVFSVKADASTTGLELTTGSIGINILGTATPIFRVKEAFQTGSHSGSGEWEPLFALRRNPNNSNVFMNLSDVEIGEVSVDADVEILVISVDSSKTDADTWVTPEYHSETNSALQETTNVTTFPDASGTVVTSAPTTGGFQIGMTAYYTAGTGTNKRTGRSSGIRKRSIPNGDVGIVLAKTSSAMDITIDYQTDQEW